MKRALLIDPRNDPEAAPYIPLFREAAAALCTFACNGSRGRTHRSVDVPKGHTPRSADPIYGAVTEQRHAWAHRWKKFYSSCGDLTNWMWFRLGVRERYINRDENPALPVVDVRQLVGFRRWRMGLNVSMPEAGAPGVYTARADDQYYPGDVLRNGDDGTGRNAVHVSVVLQHDLDEVTIANYGQPGGAIKVVKLTTRGTIPYLGRRPLRKVIRLDEVILDASERGNLVAAEVPDSFVGGLPLDDADLCNYGPDTDPSPPLEEP